MDSSGPKLQEDVDKAEFVDEHNIANIAVDESDEAYFHFMKDILAKSGLTLSSSEWHTYASEQPMLDPALLELEPDWGPDELLLFDLINEALVDTYAYEASLRSSTWVPRYEFHLVMRPLHLDGYMIEEVWTRLKRQLDCFVEVATEDVVAADFRNKDGWMDLNFGSELVGLDLEDWIIEDLVHEVVTELGESQINPSF
jgi:Domain of unknown function (DUF4378)